MWLKIEVGWPSCNPRVALMWERFSPRVRLRSAQDPFTSLGIASRCRCVTLSSRSLLAIFINTR